MRKANSSREYACDVSTFWDVFLSEDYTKKFYLEALGFPTCEILAQSATERRMRVVPRLDMPKAVTKVLGDSFGYTEEATIDRDGSVYRWQMKPNTMGDKLRTEGVIRIEAVSDDRCRRRDEVTVEAKIFGVGKLIEASAEKQIQDSWGAEADFFRRYLASRP
ncbi:MAG: DUF2505 domain-containing protein [Myxococcota bacterium]